MLISHAHGRPASTTTMNTIYYVWAKRGREKLKLKYEASTWQVRLMPNGTLHTKQKTLDKFLTEAKSFPNIMCSPDFRRQARILWPETLQLPPSRQGGLRRGVAPKSHNYMYAHELRTHLTIYNFLGAQAWTPTPCPFPPHLLPEWLPRPDSSRLNDDSNLPHLPQKPQLVH